jgi:3-methyladenine DNA glycosylase Tag
MKKSFKVTESIEINLNGEEYLLEKGDNISVVSNVGKLRQVRKNASFLSDIGDKIEELDTLISNGKKSKEDRVKFNRLLNGVLDNYDPDSELNIKEVVMLMPEGEAEDLLTELNLIFE